MYNPPLPATGSLAIGAATAGFLMNNWIALIVAALAAGYTVYRLYRLFAAERNS